MTNTNIFEIKPNKDYVYQQYQDSTEIAKFFEIIDDLIDSWYFGETLEEMWKTRDIRDSNSYYMYFYCRYYLGLIRPVRIDPNNDTTEKPPENIINQYDTALFWDARFIWDELNNSDPEMPMSMFTTMLSYLYDYSEETWTYDLMVRYAADMCNMNPNDVQISFEYGKVILWLPNSSICRAFMTYTNQDEYKLNLPYANCYEYRLGSYNKNTDRLDTFMLGYNRPDSWSKIDI